MDGKENASARGSSDAEQTWTARVENVVTPQNRIMHKSGKSLANITRTPRWEVGARKRDAHPASRRGARHKVIQQR
jgi:hypothetical protein